MKHPFWHIGLLLLLMAGLNGCAPTGYPCPENGKTVVYNLSTNKAKLVEQTSPMNAQGESNRYDKNGLLKDRKPYVNPNAKKRN